MYDNDRRYNMSVVLYGSQRHLRFVINTAINIGSYLNITSFIVLCDDCSKTISQDWINRGLYVIPLIELNNNNKNIISRNNKK